MARTVAYKLCSWCDEHQGSRPIPEIAPKLPRCITDVQYDICIIYIYIYMYVYALYYPEAKGCFVVVGS